METISNTRFISEPVFTSKNFAIHGTVSLVVAAIGFSLQNFLFPLFLAISAFYLTGAMTLYFASKESPLVALFTEIHSIFVCIGLLYKTFFPSYHEAQLNGNPILLVHGYLAFGSIWDVFRKELSRKLDRPIYTINLRSFRSIETEAETVKNKVNEIYQLHQQPITLIGHSKGGLVSLKASEKNLQIDQVITIGAPLEGTPLAYIGLGTDASEMRPDSNLLKNLFKEKLSYRIETKHDEIVPIQKQRNEAERNTLRIRGVGHLGLLFSGRVIDAVIQQLKPAPTP